jgi:osmoprotectant transport system permease protein
VTLVFDFAEVGVWFADAANWDGRYGLWFLLGEHLVLTFGAILLAAVIAVPLGVLIGHTGKGEFVVIGLGSASRAIPTMGLLFALVLLLGVELRDLSLVLALTVIAIPPLLAGAFAGITTIPWSIRDSATAQGMTGLQRIRHVEFPLATPSIVGGFRIAFIHVVSTVVLAPLVGLGGLGFGIVQGLAVRNYAQVLASSLVIIAMTVAGDQLLGWLQQRTTARLGLHKLTEKK